MINHKVRLIFHVLGLSCIGGAVLLQALVFASILQNGYFKAVEQNPIVLAAELALSVFAFFYFLHLWLTKWLGKKGIHP